MQLGDTAGSTTSGKADRLIQSTLNLWRTRASGQLSARLIAADAGLAASSIYYYFEDLEHLYEMALVQGAKEAGQWCDAQKAALSGMAHLPPVALGPLLAAAIDDLCENQRRTAMAWRECRLLAARHARFLPLLALWDGLFRDFCASLSKMSGVPAWAEVTFLFFDGESFLHLMQWNRLPDRAGLEEMATGWASWVAGQVPVEGAWRLHLWHMAWAALPAKVNSDAVRLKIAAAGAALLVAEGVAGITHRAVAAGAGLTLGVVAHHCRRTGDLLQLAYSAVYIELTGKDVPRPDDKIREITSVGVPTRRQMLGVEELVMAVARGSADPSLATRLRYLRGATTAQFIAEHMGADGAPPVLMSAIYSSVMIGKLCGQATNQNEGALTLGERLLKAVSPGLNA